jgi:hypothetical protein
VSETREGGCLCGAVRYSVDWPPMVVATCSCKNCQKQAGSALSVIAVMPSAALRVTGALTTYTDTAERGKDVYRKFCGTCGSPVITETPEATEQGLVFIKAGTLDDASDLSPSVHYWTCSAPAWMVLPENGLRLEKQ